MRAGGGPRIPYFCGVYAIRNRRTGSMYVGSTVDLSARWNAHLAAFRKGTGIKGIQSDWDTYGGEAFELVMLEEIPRQDKQELKVAENRWMTDLAERGVELHNTVVPVPREWVSVVEWEPETMLPANGTAASSGEGAGPARR